MSVFVLIKGWYYEGSTVLGVYSTLEKARAAADQYIAEHGPSGDYMEVDEYPMDGDAGKAAVDTTSIYGG